ncbi:MAG: hypothetical protein KVP17_001006 [Porospora cf. gigantea B]|uniref:uncharacterized protein n=1 Tax=Porospora cf. gigantea B TaxID=2853592 RepID=UPI003571CCCE|nr:MAG: hypothetical protein KVP17_001006 [Porospora cf. gigantea B]
MQEVPLEEAKEALNAISMWTDVPLANASRVQSPAWMLPVSLSQAEDLAVYKGDSRLTPEAALTDDVESDSEQNVGAVFKALSASIKTSYAASASSDGSSQSCTKGGSKSRALCYLCNLNHSRKGGGTDFPICHGCDDDRATLPRVNSDDHSVEKMLRDALWDVQTALIESVGSDLNQRGLLPPGISAPPTSRLGSGVEGTKSLIRYVTSLVSSTEKYHSVLRSEINQLQEKLLLLEDQLTEAERKESAKNSEEDDTTTQYTVEVTKVADYHPKFEYPVIAKTTPRCAAASLKQRLAIDATRRLSLTSESNSSNLHTSRTWTGSAPRLSGRRCSWMSNEQY